MRWNTPVLVWLLPVVYLMAFLSPLMAGEVTDEFDGPNLDSKLWVIKEAGNASHSIKDGVLTMSSPTVDSSSILYFPINIADLDITFEVAMDTSSMGDHIVMGGLAGLMEPAINTEIGWNWLSLFLLVPNNAILKQDPDQPGQAFPPTASEVPYDPGWRVFKIEFGEDKTIFYIDDKEVGEVEKNKKLEERYFHLSPDDFTSHYSGEVAIEYIRISGPGADVLAVEPLGRLATTWAKVKG